MARKKKTNTQAINLTKPQGTKKPKRTLKPSVTKNLTIAGTIAGTLALALSSFNTVALTNQKIPTVIEIQQEITRDSRAEFQAQNFLTVWLTGTDIDKNTLNQFTTNNPVNKLNEQPVTVYDINTADKKLQRDTENGQRYWTFTLAATVDTPGIGPQRNYYQVDVRHDPKTDTFTMNNLPRPVNYQRDTTTFKNNYEAPVSTQSPLYTAANNFTQAYLTQGQSGTLGRYVTENFTDQPLANTTYTSATIDKVLTETGINEQNIPTGGTIKIIVRANAYTTPTTYQVIDLPLELVKQSNGQYLVQSFTTPNIR